MKVAHSALAVAALLFACPVEAQEARRGLPAGIDVAVPVAEPGTGDPIAPRLAMRMDAPVLAIQYRIAAAAREPDGTAAQRSGRILATGFAPQRGLHLSGGLRFRRNKAWALAAPMAQAQYLLGGRHYSAIELGVERAGTASSAPLVTIGYGGMLARHLAFGIEAGALFHGAVQASCAPVAQCGGMGAALDAERLGVNRSMGQYRVHPLLQVRMGYRF